MRHIQFAYGRGHDEARHEAVLKSAAASTGVILVLVACASSVKPAHAQFSALGPVFSRLTGGVLWGSLGFRNVQNPERIVLSDPHPIVRGGFAALYGPFGGQPDTTVQLDSVRTTVEAVRHPELAQAIEGADSVRTVRATRSRSTAPGRATWASVAVGDTIRTVRSMHSHYTIPGREGWISLAVGYEYSSSYRVDLSGSGGTLSSTFPVGGFYAAAYFGPFPLWHAPPSVFWYAGVGASLVELNDANGLSDTTFVRFDTERALGPEAQLLLGWRLRRGVRALAGMSAQHIGWSAIRYRAPSEEPLPDDVLRRLPDTLGLTSVHLMLGLSFDASDLFTR
jgi:hypothetical protein